MATAGELHPTEGIRLLLERERVEEDGGRAIYRATIYTPTSSFCFDALLQRGAGAELNPRDPDAVVDPIHQKRLNNLLGSIARAAERKHTDGLPPWPERVMRWRGPGRG